MLPARVRVTRARSRRAAVFKALYLLYSVACQPIYIGLDSAFTSRATGIRARPEERRSRDERARIIILAKLRNPLEFTSAPIFV